MEKELDPSIIKATQTSLGKYVKRPPLSDKLLKKPPFRFLHDIITTVLKTTGFFEGLFEEDELVSDNVKDRESKILFLNKVISVVGLANGKPLSVKPSKVVAGQEPDKTNELLQCLAQVLEKKISSDEAVRKYKEGAKPVQTVDTKTKEPSKAVKKSTDSNKLTSRSNEKLTNQKKEKRDGSLVKTGTKEKVSKLKDRESTLKQEPPPKISTQKPKVISKKPSVENTNQQPDINNTQPNKKLSKTSSKDLTKSLVNKDEDQEKNGKESETVKLNPESEAPQESETEELVKEKLDTSYTIADTDLNSSSSHDLLETQNKLEENQEINLKTPHFPDPVTTEEDHRDTQVKNEEKVNENLHDKQELNVNKIQNNINNFRQNSVDTTEKNNENRVISANKNSIVPSQPVRPTSVRPSSSRPGAPRLRDKHSGTAQASDNLLVGKVNIITENAPNEEEEDASIIIVDQPQSHNTSAEQPDQLAINQHGHLVQQILDSQKEFSQVSGKTEIEWQFGAQKAREASNQEIEQVKFNIQAVSRAANPLGKLLDHIQEDVEVMRQELQQWTRTYDETSKELSKQKAANDDSLLPLHTKIKNLDADIKEKLDKIDDLKIVIHKNSSRIEKLLASGSVQ
ncbi:TRAF3-interacting protein 1-like [Cydia pomonella]|uniref:TRAF3-interacting protein 1-like n=1 Tax=Cydia pomonella TaxID=82600 RepID=UPI002ADD9D7E|nr:TRAF3-interacting protein 1-like [Cydia pomonella]